MNIRSLSIVVLGSLIWCLPLFPVEVNFQGPLCGYYVDPVIHSVQPIMGIPGSATLGPVLATGFDSVWVAPDGHTALGTQQGTVFLVPNLGDASMRTALMPWTGQVDNVAWSDDSSGALLYSSARGTIRLATGLQANPVVNPEVDITALGNPIPAFRLAKNTWNIAVIVRETLPNATRAPSREGQERSAANSLYLLTPQGVASAVPDISNPIGMDFSRDGESLYVLDRSNQIWTVPFSSPDTIQSVLLVSKDASPNFDNLITSSDGKFLYVLQSHAQTACGYEISSGNSTFCTSLDVTPSGFQHLSGSLYLLMTTDNGTTPRWVLDASHGQTFFVPYGGGQ
jgi:hypothetical protein